MVLKQEIIDTHCHLNMEVFVETLDTTLEQAQRLGVMHMIVPGVTKDSWATIQQISKHARQVHAAYGLHPCFCDYHNEQDIDLLITYCEQYSPVAIGEIGLDYFISNPDLEKQSRLFVNQLQVAKDFNLPVIVHCRKAHDQCLKKIKQSGHHKGGVIHAYSGSLEQAKRYLDAGFKLGIGGAATYDRAKKLHCIIQSLPLSSFVLETDAPDIPPCFARGKPNTPLNLPEIATRIAEHVNIPLHTLIENTTFNARSLFAI